MIIIIIMQIFLILNLLILFCYNKINNNKIIIIIIVAIAQYFPCNSQFNYYKNINKTITKPRETNHAQQRI